MSSTVVNMPEATMTSDSGIVKYVPQFMQFVPGRAEIVILNQNNYFVRSSADKSPYEENINTIIAFPYYNKIKRRTDIYTEGDWDKYRYYPLLRGMYEMPAQGDPVLLCSFGGKNFFLGPLNTENNVNWNEDMLLSKMFPPEYSQDEGTFNDLKFTKEQSIHNKAFPKQRHRRRLQKYQDHTISDSAFTNLDNPLDSQLVSHGHGDMLLEGRHGNAIRVGSRYKNPYIFISNGLTHDSDHETLGIGSTFAMIEKGTTWQHFTGYKSEDYKSVYTATGLVLGSDRLNTSTRKIEYSLHMSKNLTEDFKPGQHIRDYDAPQMILDSHRITLNSKMEDIYISSFSDIHLGAQNSITVTAKDDLIFNTKYTYLGAPSKLHHYNNELDDGDEAKDDKLPLPEPMVLGQELVNILNELVDTLSTACYVTPAGAVAPLVDNLFRPIAIEDNPGLEVSGSEQLVKDAGGSKLTRKSLITIKEKLEGIKSEYHFIENNDEDKNPTDGTSPKDEQTGGSVE